MLQAKGTWLQKISPDAQAIIHLKMNPPPPAESVAQNTPLQP